jgi:hypothetical protein
MQKEKSRNNGKTQRIGFAKLMEKRRWGGILEYLGTILVFFRQILFNLTSLFLSG